MQITRRKNTMIALTALGASFGAGALTVTTASADTVSLSGSDGTDSNTSTAKTQHSTRWVDESGNKLTALETSETGYDPSKTFNGYELVSDDVNEDTHTKTYHYKKKVEIPVKQVVTHWADLDGNKLKVDENGQHSDNDGKSDIDGWDLVSTKTDADGNVTNTYKKHEESVKKVVTHWVDEENNKLKDDEDGQYPDTDGVSDIDGYTLASTKTDADGNVTNTYKKEIHTSWVDENGNKLKDDEDGNRPDNDDKSDIPDYELVSTTTDKDGNTINTYWVDQDGKKLKDDQDGNFPDNDDKSDIPDYELVSATTDKNGNVTNTYKKKEAPAPAVKKTETSAPAPAVKKTETPASAPAVKKLPQTGEEGAEELGMIGASLMGMATTISAVVVRGKKRKED